MRVVIATLIALTLFIVPAYAQQYWNLSNVYNATSNVYYMYSGTPTLASGSKSVDIPPNGYAIWVANQSAQVDVTFPAATWIVYLEGNVKGGSTGNITIHVGVWDGTTFTSYGDITITGVSFPTTAYVSVSSFTVPKGCRLALKIDNIGTTTVSIKVVKGKTYSYLEYPSDFPPYPIPEVATFALVLAGIVAIRNRI